MPSCSRCGYESGTEAAYCPRCGTQLTAADRTRAQRKTVTVLFCDITGSTALGEALDAEALRALLARYYERLRRIIEAHGGTVEKFIGDAVMAVFGVPVLHEDDALRAVRAAATIREALPELGVEARIGVNTGEIVAGSDDSVALGDAVNVAARLEQAATPGEVLVGAQTARRVRNAVDLEPVPPLTLKGKSKPVPAYRVMAVHEMVERAETPMVGREPVLHSLHDAFGQAVQERSCQLVTVLGGAGVGKSRLAREFVKGVDARVVRGRCLSYGEGITYWPVIEVVNQLGRLSAEDPATMPLRSLVGKSETGTSADEIAWAFRKLLERRAQQSELICVLDDLHWGDETFLDLVEHLVDLARDAPILLLCLARPELLDLRPSWAARKRNAVTVQLEPLDAAESDQLLDVLGVRERGLRGRIIAAAEGNPLFVEEMVALARESGQLEPRIPPTIHAVLAARLDQLDAGERSVLERGAVEGRTFHRSAVQALGDDHAHLTGRLVSLVRKELLQPEPAQLSDDEAYRFRHLLIRDVAYEAIPKTERAEMHQRFAVWLDRRGGGVELDELVGHHLEQAARYKRELGQPDVVLAERAGLRVAAAGRRALWRGDNRAAEGLLRRALGLVRPARLDVSLELDFASAQPTPGEAAAIAEAAAERAASAANHQAAAVARAVAVFHRLLAGEADVDELEKMVLAALPLLDEREDHASLVHMWVALGYGVANTRCRFADWAEAAEQALSHARLAGQRPAHLFSLDLTLVLGPTPADEALRTLDAVLPETPHPQALLFRAQLLAMLGRFDDAWPSALEASERLREVTAGPDRGEVPLAEIAALSGDYEQAASHLRGFCDFLTAHGQHALLATFAPMLGRALCQLGRYEEAEPQAQLGRELGEEHDIATQALWRQVQALVDANNGRHAEAEALAREASAIIERTDALNYQGAALSDLAQVLIRSGQREEAHDALAHALERYSRKMNLAAVAQTRARIATLQADAPASDLRLQESAPSDHA